MKRIILSAILAAAAGAAGAQTMPAPSTANAPAERHAGPAATAQKRIEQDGYTNVRDLAKGEDGLWRGTATRGGTQVEVTVDRSGHVSAR